MKIAYVTALFPFAPQEQFFEPELRSLGALADVLIVPLRPPSARNHYPSLGPRVIDLPLLSLRVLWLAALEALRAPRAALGALWGVIFGASSWRSRGVNALVVPKSLAVARLLRREGVEHVHAAWLTTPATLAYVVERVAGIPFSISAHSHDLFAENLVAAKVEASRFVRVISERNCRRLQRCLPKSLAPRCTVVHLGVDAGPPAPAPPPRVPRLVCIARLHPIKGHRYLIEALGRLRARDVDFTCDFVGDGELRAEIAAHVEREGLSRRVRLCGNVPHADVLHALRSGDYDLAVLASLEHSGEREGIPISAVEAMAAGLPVVATRTGSLPELVVEGTGALVEQRDPVALADALERFLADAPARRAAGEAARAVVLERFETGTTTRRLLTLMVTPSPGRESIVAQPAALGPWTQPEMH